MADSTVIRHLGIISETEGSHVTVSIQASSACSACHAKSACGLGENKEKIVEVSENGHNYTVGEQVMVNMEQSLGLKAVFFGYLLPFMVLMISLIICIKLTGTEGLSALISLGLLAPYYFALYHFRDKMKRMFTFKIQKII